MEEVGPTEETLLQQAVNRLQTMLPPRWVVGVQQQVTQSTDSAGQPIKVDQITVQTLPAGATAALLVEARSSFSPRDAARLFEGIAKTFRAVNPNNPLLLVAPWLSPRTREILQRQDINYLDLTGNVRIALSYPGTFISAQGSNRDPAPQVRGKAGIRGPRAGRLIRELVDVAPPYGVTELATATGLAAGYVSSLLEALSDEALIDRPPRGKLSRVDIEGLLRRWVVSYDVLRSNRSSTFVSPQGPVAALREMSSTQTPTRYAVTGSFAASRIAPVAAPALLMAYCQDSAEMAGRIGLLPADTGANVVLLEPFDPIVWERTAEADGIKYVAPAQVVMDCLTGTGRMPAEGDAVLAWMLKDESRWRISTKDPALHSWAARE
jgi:hypothetical protein